MFPKRWFVLSVVCLAAAVSAAAYCITPGCPLPVFGQGDLQIFWNGSGELSLAWPEADSCAEYQVSVRSSSQHFEERCTDTRASFSGLSDGERLRVAVRAVSEGENLFGMVRQVKSWKTLKASVSPVEVSALTLEGTIEPGNVWLSWNGTQGKRYEICAIEDGISYPVASTRGKALTLRFGAELEYPSSDQPFDVVVREGFSGKGYTLYGPPSNRLSLKRSDLMNDRLFLTWEETEPWHYTLLWSEARGDSYKLQQWRNGGWETIFSMDSGPQSVSYDVGRVGSGSLQRYRLASEDRAGNELYAEEISFYADVSPVYAAVWPVTDLTCYAAPNTAQPQGSIPAGTTLCVLEESGEWFQVRYQDEYVYIDKRFCLINLPEYLGDYCAYDITNSYASAFKVHDRPLAQITRQPLPGFEHVQTKGGFLVPCLYPCAEKLLDAAKAAIADGNRLKIYEAFRPQQASDFLYETVSKCMELPALREDADGNAVDPVTGERVDLSTGLPPEPEEEDTEETDSETAEPEEDAAGSPGTQRIPVDPNPPERPEAPEPAENSQTDSAEPQPVPDTYLKIMAGNRRLTLDDFLGSGISGHSQGTALDITLEELDSGAELAMQSRMHDLSWHSTTYQNNDHAKRLADYLTAAGMSGTAAEWWHFQDNSVLEILPADAGLAEGVSPFGLVRDSQGWRCRTDRGTFAKNTIVTVDEIPYTVDEDGYLID